MPKPKWNLIAQLCITSKKPADLLPFPAQFSARAFHIAAPVVTAPAILTKNQLNLIPQRLDRIYSCLADLLKAPDDGALARRRVP